MILRSESKSEQSLFALQPSPSRNRKMSFYQVLTLAITWGLVRSVREILRRCSKEDFEPIWRRGKLLELALVSRVGQYVELRRRGLL